MFLARGYAGSTLRLVAIEAGVSVPTIESLFGTKARLLKAAIDIAIAGDDEPIPVLDRAWARSVQQAETVEEFLTITAGVLVAAQRRSAGLILAVFEGSTTDPELAELVEQLIAQRAGTAEWLVDEMSRKAPRQADCTRQEAVDTLWLLMDPAVFIRLTRHRHWTAEQWQRWFARSVARLLTASPTPHLDSAPDLDLDLDQTSIVTLRKASDEPDQ
jgi:AcrR family transcriptional regulator